MKQAQVFLEKREQVRITLVLKGRQRGRQLSAVEFLQEIHETYFTDFGNLIKPPTDGNLSLTYNPASKH
jgi:translation initiation factor IF-3